MRCRHMTINGKQCNNGIIGDSDYCYLKSHHTTSNEYDMIRAKLIDKFTYDTCDPDMFQLHNVDGDGACLYRSFAQAIYKRIERLCDHPLYNEIWEIIQEVNTDYLDNDTETTLAIYMQKIIKNWLYEKQDHIVHKTDYTVTNLVKAEHAMTMKMYYQIYNRFAGKSDFITAEAIRYTIPFRWGGSPEQYAFSSIFKFKIDIYELWTLDRRKLHLKQANFRHKLKRMKLIQSFCPDDVLDTTHFYYTTVKDDIPHYMYMHPIS